MSIFLVLITVFQLSTSCLDNSENFHDYIEALTIEEGQSLQLNCYNGGDPYLPIKWYKVSNRGNSTLPGGESNCECGNTLEFPSITKDQRGEYFCNTDFIWPSTSRYFKINVNFIPNIFETFRIDSFESKQLKLTCIVEAYPPPEISWLKNNLFLYPNDQYQIINYDKCNDVYNSTLIISMEFDYYGIYMCRIKSNLGLTSMTFTELTPHIKTSWPADYDGTRGP